MKTRNLFLSLFAFAALCACNKEAQPETPQVLDADTYIKVNIMATGASTRAYEYGEADENAVHNVVFLFYGEGDKPVLAEGTDYDWNHTTTPNNVAVKSATVKFKAQTDKPTSMIVVLNYGPNESDINTLKGLTLGDAKQNIANTFSISTGTPAVTYYTMTNSVYVDGSTVVCEVPLTDSNFGKTTTEGATADAVDPVDVYVERVAAKAVLTNNIEPSDITSTPVAIEGNAISVTPVVVGYDVVNTPNKSYLFKNVLSTWAYPDWNLPTDHRSFWAKTCDLTLSDYSNKKYNEIVAVSDPIYMFENTSENRTKVILTAYLTVPDDTFGSDGDTDADIVDLVKYNSTYYTFDGFVTEAKEAVLASKGIDLSGKTLVAVPETNNYEMHLALADGHGLADDVAATVNNALALMVASYWKDGKCYYYTEIKHDLRESNAIDAPVLKGVVRNHVYKISLDSLAGLGIPVSGENTSTIVPDTPDSEYYSLNATINILQWKIVEQGVDFNN